MKKVFVTLAALALLTLPLKAFAVDWHTANQSSVKWNAVTTSTDGSDITATGDVAYRVYLANAITDPNKTNPTKVAETADLNATITLNTEGMYYVGISAVRKVSDDGGQTFMEVGESEIAWSDDPAQVEGGTTFGIRYFLPPAKPGGIGPM